MTNEQPAAPSSDQQGVGVVPVGLGVVRVADVDAHRQAEQLAAEVVLQPGPQDLLAVVEVLRPDEPDDGVDEQRLEAPGDAVGAGLQRLLVDGAVDACASADSAAPCPVSKYVSSCRRCRGRSASAASCASASMARVTPNPRVARPRCRRPTGTPGRPARPPGSARSVVVTWASTHDWAGIS